MKTILVDAINTFINKNEGVFEEMHALLEKYPNKKIILSSADDGQIEKYGLKNLPYEFFTLKHNPEKTDPKYYELMLQNFGLKVEDVIYFEHDEEAVKSAKSIGIITYHYNKEKKSLKGLKNFIDKNI